MKKLVTLALCLMMLLTSTSLAEGMGVQVIGGPAVETEPVSLDDFKLNSDVTIDGYAVFTGTYFDFVDRLGHYDKGRTNVKYTNGNNDYYESGTEAEYALIKVDIVNVALTPKNFLEQCEVRVIFDDLYEYAGWYYQYNSNLKRKDDVIHKDDVFAIDPMYEGHYCFGCTLPNAVINSKKPLKMIITIDGNEITYNIRK